MKRRWRWRGTGVKAGIGPRAGGKALAPEKWREAVAESAGLAYRAAETPSFQLQKKPGPTMASYKEPSLQERAALAREARDKALKALAARAPVDPAVVAQRQAAAAAREAAAAEKSAARKAAIAQAKADKKAAASVPAKPSLSEAELKAARDERYAARKKRKG